MRIIDKRVDGYTRTQWKLLQVLSDGKPHTKQELHACLPDDLSQVRAVARHISAMRKNLPPNQDIVCVFWRRKWCYQHICLLPIVAPPLEKQLSLA